MARAAKKPTPASGGRELGPRALQTRHRLLEATADLLEQRLVRDVSVVDIARRAGTSPATFYQYFRDVSEATLRLAEEAGDEMKGVLDLIDEGPWEGEAGLERARSLVEAFLRHWDAHRAVLLVRNLAADQGDRDFQRVRSRTLTPVLDHLARQIEASQRAGRVPTTLKPRAAAAAMCTILERLAAYHRELAQGGVTRDDLVETSAHLLHQTVAGG